MRKIKGYDVCEMEPQIISVHEAAQILTGAIVLNFEWCSDGRDCLSKALALEEFNRGICDVFLTVITSAGEIKIVGVSGCYGKWDDAEINCPAHNDPAIINLCTYIKKDDENG